MASETREGMVFKRLFEKLEQEKQALGGKVFDILGKVSFNNRPLRELLIEAVRGEKTEEAQSQVEQVIDNAFDKDALLQLLREHALTEDVMDVQSVNTIRENMERMEARKLQPHFIEAFFREAFSLLGGRMAPREKGRYEISFVPAVIRSRDRLVGYGEPVLQRYERVCFDKVHRHVSGSVPAALICPGHPLLGAVLDILRERSADLLKRGAILIDENDASDKARLLFYIQHSIQDGTPLPSGKRVISRHVHFMEMDESGTASHAGYAPYLDYRPASDEEQKAVLAHVSGQDWLCRDVENSAVAYAVTRLVPEHLAEVRSRREALIAKTEKAVKERLTTEIHYWDFRAADLALKEKAGKRNSRLNSRQAQRRAEELTTRLHKRMAELEAERTISALPPVIVGGALIIPAGLLARLTGHPLPEFLADAASRKAVEMAAMQAVMEIESSLGFEPYDVSASRCGYDIESRVPEGHQNNPSGLRFIEVKGRAAGASSVTVTRNEILTGLNQPENFILALVEVDGQCTRTVYLKRPFTNPPDFSTESCTFNIAALRDHAAIVYEK